MFVRQPSFDSLVISSGDILLLLISLNRPMVALEDYATDEADATICTVRRESDMVSTVVHLLLQQGRTALFFTFESDPYPEDLRGPVEEEAIDFVESLGFIMDDTRFSELDPDEQKVLRERPIFTGALDQSPPPRVAETALEVAPDPAFQFEPMTPERLEALSSPPDAPPPAAPEARNPVHAGEQPAPRAEAPAPPPSADSFRVALPEASLQEMEIVLDEVFQDSRAPQVQGPAQARAVKPVPAAATVVAAPRPAPRVPEAEPVAAVAPGEGPSPLAGTSLSRFRRKGAPADLYTIHGVGGVEGVPRAAETPPPPPSPRTAVASSLPQARPAEDGPPAPDVRRRRARARFLASF